MSHIFLNGHTKKIRGDPLPEQDSLAVVVVADSLGEREGAVRSLGEVGREGTGMD